MMAPQWKMLPTIASRVAESKTVSKLNGMYIHAVAFSFRSSLSVCCGVLGDSEEWIQRARIREHVYWDGKRCRRLDGMDNIMCDDVFMVIVNAALC